ncbi:MAG: T9SS type A sorting domain-containing protein, partial [Chitinophagaceae bacterium]
GSGIVVSTNGTGTVSSVTITKNRCFNNTGLGIDLNFIDVTGSTLISVNDDGDVDSGPNALQNFPIIDSVKFNASLVYVWGKAPANSILEFFTSDGQANKHGGLGLNYGEGKNFIASAVEGSAGDAAGGTGSYNIDGNVATNNVNMFQFVFSYSGLLNVDSLTATATVNGNTSEFGPKTFPVDVLGCTLLKFTAAAKNSKATLNWEAICDNNFMHYLVEHSTDGVRFSSLGRVYADAVGSIKRSQFEHLQHSADIHFYRLKMVNRDGTFKYSQTITINNSSTGTNDVLVTQNPFNHQISFNINRASRAELQITLLDAAGNTLVSKQQTAVKGKNLLILNDLGSLPSGLYRLVVASPEKIVVKNVLKK